MTLLIIALIIAAAAVSVLFIVGTWFIYRFAQMTAEINETFTRGSQLSEEETHEN